MDGALPLHIRQDLKQLGLTDNDILIITFLFHADKASVKEISRQTAISYSSCEYLCNNLHRMGLLGHHMSGEKQFFSVCLEADFLSWLEDKKRKTDESFQHAAHDIKEFFKLFRDKSWKPEFLYFQGIEGIKEIYEDMLQSKGPICGWRDIALLQKMFGKAYLDSYIKRRVEKGIESYAITPDNKINREYASRDQKRPTRFVKNLILPGEIRMYDHKVAIVTIHEESPVGFLMTGVLTYKIFKSIFDQAWKK